MLMHEIGDATSLIDREFNKIEGEERLNTLENNVFTISFSECENWE